MNWLTIKAKLWAFGAIALGVLAAILRFRVVKEQRDNAREQRDQAEAKLKWRDDVEAVDVEIDNEFSDREARAKEDRRRGKVPEHLRNSNSW